MKERENMVRLQIEKRGIANPAVLAAMRKVPRHNLLPAVFADEAYVDSPLPIGYGQTISQPYIVALMTELLQPRPEHKVLEIGTGSGYQAAILAELVKDVYTVEIIEALAEDARNSLDSAGYKNIHFRCADGGEGWEEYAPFDSIIITAACVKIPEPLIAQLKTGGRMVVPIGGVNEIQTLSVVDKTENCVEIKPGISVRFVPMTGASQNHPFF